MRIDTPKNMTLGSGKGTKVRIVWNPSFKPIWTNAYTSAQKYVDSEVLRLSDKYVPLRTGALKQSGYLGTVIGSGRVVYNSPYARYMYYGKVMRDAQGRALYGKAPKHVTDEPLTYHGAPQRGAFWFERMKAAHGHQILKGAARRMSKIK